MPDYYCIDPLDPYAEREVLVTYEVATSQIAIKSVIDEDRFDIVQDLSDECLRILQLELVAYCGHAKPFAWAERAVGGVSVPEAA